MGGRSGKLISINSSGGGVPKRPVLFSMVNELGLEDDRHVEEGHGGPERAICIFPLEHIKALRAEGHPIDIGTTGENFTVEGLDWSLVVPGARLAVGPEVLLEVTSFTVPCKTIAGSFTDGCRSACLRIVGDFRQCGRYIRQPARIAGTTGLVFGCQGRMVIHPHCADQLIG